MSITSHVPSQTYPNFESLPQPTYNIATLTSAGALTYTAAQILGGYLLRDPNGAGRSDIMPTAALLVAAAYNPHVNSGFELIIKNTADAGETITLVAGTGCTLVGTCTIAQNYTARFLVVFTNVTSGSEAYSLYDLGTAAH
jgi:hypothetical protein